MQGDTSEQGKTFVVTGANTGIGRATAIDLARRGGKVWLACRSEEKTRPVVDEIRAAGGQAEFMALDLASLADVRRAALVFLDRGEKLDVLVNNAGLAGLAGTTKDGFELTFGTNHLGHFLLTNLLLPKLREKAGARIVNVSSKAHYDAKNGIDYSVLRNRTATVTGLPEYAVSKLANVLFTAELARGKAGPNVHSYALHPGVVASDAWRQIPWPFRSLIKLFMLSNEDGAKTTLYCATSPEVADHDGRYYDDSREKKASRFALDPAAATELWTKSEEMVASFMK
jgi:NAD(P)-dependent dehydrogenase (short-subunit alcohol dehydrogenase family)